jgi:hypothetical protein
MRKIFIRFSVAIVTFVSGVVLTGVFGSVSFSVASLEPVEINDVTVQLNETKQALTFKSKCGIACGNDVTYTCFEAHDGAIIGSTLIYGMRSETSVFKRFQREIRKADRIIENGPYLDYWKRKLGERAIIEKNSNFLIIKYSKNSSKYDNSYHMLIREAPSRQHAIEFDDQEESLSRSFYVNRLKP